jgi:hypothetical protein
LVTKNASAVPRIAHYKTKNCAYCGQEFIPISGIQKTRITWPNFPFDIVCERDGRKFVIEVTTNIFKRNIGRVALAHNLGLEVYFLFIKPDHSGYILLKPIEPFSRKIYRITKEMLNEVRLLE